MSVVVRDAKLRSDKPALLRFIAGLNKFEAGFEHDRRLDGAFPEEFLTELVGRAKEKQGRIFIAEDRGKALGWAMCYVEQHETFVRPELRPFGYIAEMFVEEAARGRHVGRMLLKACEDHFRATPARSVVISALIANTRAVRAYTSAGYADYAVNLRKLI